MLSNDEKPTLQSNTAGHLMSGNSGDALEKQVIALLQADNLNPILEIIYDLYPEEVINLLEVLDDNQIDVILSSLDEVFLKDLVLWLRGDLFQRVKEKKGMNFIIASLKDVSDDDLTNLVRDLNPSEKEQLLHSISFYKRRTLENYLNYKEDSAGRLMQSLVISIPKDWKVSQAIYYIKEIADFEISNIPENLHDIFIVEEKGRVIGRVHLSSLIINEHSTNVLNIMDNNFKTIPVDMDQEEVALLFKNRDFVSAAVVDNEGVLLGVINIDDIVDVIYKEHGEDILLIGGVNPSVVGGYKYLSLFKASATRIRWLMFNFTGALIIPVIVGGFESILTKHIILAGLIQMVVSIGGNAGLQSLSVTLRGIVTNTITVNNALRQIISELRLAMLNGIFLALIGYALGYFWSTDLKISIVIFLSIFCNILVGVILGTFTPLFFRRIKVDPAVASSVFITMFTDIIGFFVVLLIAYLVL